MNNEIEQSMVIDRRDAVSLLRALAIIGNCSDPRLDILRGRLERFLVAEEPGQGSIEVTL